MSRRNSNLPVAVIYDMNDPSSKGRILLQLLSLLTEARPVSWESEHILSAMGNIVEALKVLMGTGVVLCGIAGREETESGENGHTFVYGYVGGTLLFCTTPTLGLLRKFVPDLSLRAIDIDRLVKACRPDTDETFQFRTCDAAPWGIEDATRNGGKILYKVSKPYDATSIQIPSNSVWYIDKREERPNNLKLTVTRDEVANFEPERTAKICITKERWGIKWRWTKKMKCYATLADIPNQKWGLYPGSSGLGKRRFLEIAIQGGSAAQKSGVRVGNLVSIEIT